MNLSVEILKLLFGLKLRYLRQKNNISIQEVREKTGLSLSYLSEIESGKKYPKNDKILLLSAAVGIPFEELISPKVPRQLQPVAELLQSDFFNHFPLEMFGLNAQKILDIFSLNPGKLNAFIKTMLQIGRNYEMRQEHLYHAALRSYQEINNNYFKDLEQATVILRNKYVALKEIPVRPQALEHILLQEYNIKVDRKGLAQFPSLKDLRSYYDVKSNVLYINNNLREEQLSFVMARELAFQFLKINIRPEATPPVKEGSFELLLNNHNASYLAAALLIPEEWAIRDIRRFATRKNWEQNLLVLLMRKYNATPEMLMQRLTNLLPQHFNINSLFFLRFVSDINHEGEFKLTKELHISAFHQPHANELNEHYCRRWISLGIINDIFINNRGDVHSIAAGAQISQYYGTDHEYLILAIGFPNASHPEQVISVSIGFKINTSVKKKIRFLSDKNINVRVVNNTCERCPIYDCLERAAPPTVVVREKQNQELMDSLNQMINN